MSNSVDVCRYSVSAEELPDGFAPLTCSEPTWNGHDRCLWHAKVDQKPVDYIANEWDNAPDRIDGIYLRDIELGNRIDFSDKALYAGDFRCADLTQANFSNADLDFTDFTNSTLRSANFHTQETSLREVCFNSATCVDTRFQESTLHNAKFESADLSSAKFQHSDAADAVFIGAKLHNTRLIHANLRSAEFDGAELYKSKCDNANLEEASLKDADIRGASFVDADLYDVDLRDVSANHETDFGTQICREFLEDRLAEGDLIAAWLNLPEDICSTQGPDSDHEQNEGYVEKYSSPKEDYLQERGFVRQLITGSFRLVHRRPLLRRKQIDITPLEEAEQIYRGIKQVFRENPVPERRRQFNVREKEIKRKISYISGEFSWFRWTVLRWTMRYGESAKQVLIAGLGAIIFCASLYPIWGLRFKPGGSTIQYSLSGHLSLNHLLKFFFYSLRRLISPTDGAVSPIGPSEWIALGETTFGAILIAMLIFVLGRRATT